MSCHPLERSFVRSALDRVLGALAATGAEVRHRDLDGEDFDPELTVEEHAGHRRPGVAPGLEGHAADLQWCDTLVVVYPTWWSAQPARLTGWFDRVWAAGVAWELPEGAGTLRPRLRNVRRLVAVTSHGSSRFVNGIQGPAGRRILFRWLRAMCHPLARCHWVAFYGVDRSSDADRVRWLDEVERRITRICA